ncbi:MAG: LamG domain-containing protein [Candidatus Electrothrix sp. AR5]|nr:LamG domain-containing protein [Candidatus Electrothrix sp. AR5]
MLVVTIRGDDIMKTVLCFFISVSVIFSFQGIPLASINDGLALSLSFTGDANDSSGNEHHGLVTGAVLTDDRFGSHNSAYLFDGTDYITILDSNELHFTDSFTVSVWFQPSELSLVDCVLSHVQGSMSGYQLSNNIVEGKFRWDYFHGASATWEDARNSVPIDLIDDGSWHHVVGVYQKDNSSVFLKLYVDGNKVDESIFSEEISWGDGDLFIGTNLHGIGSDYRGFIGKIDDIKIFSRSLSESEIQELYLEDNQAYQAGRQSCIDDPNSCGIKPKVVVVPLL